MENGGSGEHRPWAFDAETETIHRTFTKLHYTLLPYLTEHGAIPFDAGESLLTFLDDTTDTSSEDRSAPRGGRLPTMSLRSAISWCVLTALVGCNDYDIVKQPLRETFYQAPRETVDLLFVLDDSPSMLEEAAPVAIATDILLHEMVMNEVDLRVRAVTTSEAELLPWTAIDSLDQLDTLADQLVVPAEGDRTEAGLEVALAFARDLREDAVLHVVVLSDEDDRSEASVEELLVDLALASPAGLHVHAITGDLPAGCARAEVAADPAPRYREAAALTDGYGQSICSDTLAADLQALSFDFTGLLRRFPLLSIPDSDSVLVWVDGASVSPAAHHAWRWEAADNALVFDGFGVPPPKSRIDVEYDVAQPDRGAGLAHLPDSPE
jgi:hypothetical protein